MGRMRAAGTAALLVAALSLAAGAKAQDATDIHVVPIELRDGRVVVTGPPAALTDRDGYDNQPAFTADGDAVLYTSIRSDQADSWRHDLETGVATRLTTTAESEYSPTPIPGADRFSVVRVEADSTQRLWSFDNAGGDPRLVLESIAPVGYHAWTDDGRLALFVLGDPPTLQLADPRTGRSRVLTRDIGRSLQTVPGGRGISFTQPLGDRWWIRLLDPPGRTIRSLAPLLGPDEYHVWTPAGALLTAHGTAIYQWEEVGTGRWRSVVDLGDRGVGRITRLAVSPDGHWLTVVVDRSPAS